MLAVLVLGASPAHSDDDDVETFPPDIVVPEAPVTSPALPVPGGGDKAWQVGEASWYGPGFHGRLTANGETFDQEAFTAAHRWLPFGTRIVVTNLDNGCSITLRVTDRGPYHGNRILDCSRAAAEELGFIDTGTAHIRWDVVQWPPKRRSLRLGFGPPVATSERPLIPPPRSFEPPLPIAIEVH